MTATTAIPDDVPDEVLAHHFFTGEQRPKGATGHMERTNGLCDEFWHYVFLVMFGNGGDDGS
jgi:hypothetical protein